jgi:phage baseplate assembly protein W
MNDMLGTDIKLTEDFDLSIVAGDIELVSGVDCLKQDLSHALQTPLLAWGLDMNFGAGLTEFVNAGGDPFFAGDLRAAVKNAFETDPRIIKDSVNIEIYHRFEKSEIEIEFLPINQATMESMNYIIGTGV